MGQNCEFDVVVCGGGNAGLSAALAALEAGASVCVVEKAPREERGGNSYFTGGLFRFPLRGLDDLRQVAPDVSEAELAAVEMDPYTEDDFFEDMVRVTEYQTDPELASKLVSEGFEAVVWLAGKGVRFQPLFGRQAYKEGDHYRFYGGAAVGTVGGGTGLVDRLFEAAERDGATILYDTEAVRLIDDVHGRVRVVRVRDGDGYHDIRAGAVVLASGGFESNAEMRARYLGPDWDLAPVRGTRFNTGDGIRMAFELGAAPRGHWSSCHAVAWDLNAPPFGDRSVGDLFQKHSYPLGIIVNRLGKRFVDEGADYRNYTYAKYGREILRQPGRAAFQIFDQQVVPMLRDEYRVAQATRAEANTIEELARKLEIDEAGLVETVRRFNEAVDESVPFQPAVLDGRSTKGIDPPKSNWALRLEKPPFVGYAVTCGVTFTFGGLWVDVDARVIATNGRPIPGLYAAGELVGGLFYHNYPGGSGLTSGAVFGRTAGAGAAAFAREAARGGDAPAAAGA